MAVSSPIVARYRQLLEISSLMLSRARQQDWDALLQCEARYVVELDQARILDAQQQLGEHESRDKLTLLEQILEQDAETRRLLDARREELSRLMSASRRQQAVDQAYQGGRGSITPRFSPLYPDGHS